MFVLSKTLGLLADPRVLVFLALLVGTLLLWTGWRRLGRALVTATVAAALVLAFVPIGDWVLAPIEDRFPPPVLPQRIDGIVVLGGDFDARLAARRGRGSIGNAGAGRLIAFADLARRHPEAKLVFAGGSGSLLDQETKETVGASDLLAMLGIDPARVRFEGRSRNTYENALFSLALAAPQPGETWVLVTAASHMPRAMGSFRAAGWTRAGARLVAYPVDYWTAPGRPVAFRFEGGFAELTRALHEWMGLTVYRLLGWTDALFPAPAPQFGRGAAAQVEDPLRAAGPKPLF